MEIPGSKIHLEFLLKHSNIDCVFYVAVEIYFRSFMIQLLILLQGVLLGLSNTAGVLAGVFGTAATGYILQKGIIKLLDDLLNNFLNIID